MLKRERFDTRFPPEAWSNPEALYASSSRRRFRRVARHLRSPPLLIGAGLVFVALTRWVESTPAPAAEGPPPGASVTIKPTAKETKLHTLRQRIASLAIARARLERAAEIHQSVANKTGDSRAAEAATILRSVRDRHDFEMEQAVRAANMIIDEGEGSSKE